MREPRLEGGKHSLEEKAGFLQWFAARRGGIIHSFQEVEVEGSPLWAACGPAGVLSPEVQSKGAFGKNSTIMCAPDTTPLSH